MAVHETNGEHGTKWVDILNTVELLGPNAKLRIYDPLVLTDADEDFRFVSFTPPKAELDNGLVELEIDAQDAPFQVHLLTYTTRPGKSSAAIDSMIKNYERVTTIEAAKRAGIFGKVYGEDDSARIACFQALPPFADRPGIQTLAQTDSKSRSVVAIKK